MIVEKHGRIPIKSWCNNPEEGALEQARNLANLPFAFRHIALAPDCHQGYGMPIGGVCATENVIVPNMVGMDIGCGMMAVKTSIKEIQTNTLEHILNVIRRNIPTGFNHHKIQCDHSKMPLFNEGQFITEREEYICKEQYESARYQMGTLGGGNHFIEIQRGDDGMIWFMIHSGSRNLGYKVATHYNNIAKEVNAKWFSAVPKEWELAFLPVDTKEAKSYISEMEYCLDFAQRNREQMANVIKGIIHSSLGGHPKFTKEINIHHNYVSLENHFGRNVWVHRKGATSAREGELGIIPGSQGTSSYIVRGLGNRESFNSCSHGAGRVMGRKEAKRTLDLDKEQALLNDKGILHKLTASNLDEASSAYKDIKTVMKEQEDLVEIVTELTPLAVVKG